MVRGSVMVKSSDYRAEFDEGDGLKNRCRFVGKKQDPASADFTYTYRLR
jgi:hypothetical protein